MFKPDQSLHALVCLFVVFSSQALAQPGGMDFGTMDMQALQKEGEKLEACMAGIKESDLKKLEAQANKFEKEIDGLCAAGQRDEAQSRALNLARQMNEDPTLLKIRDCSKDLSAMMAKMLPQSPLPEEYQSLESQHICD